MTTPPATSRIRALIMTFGLPSEGGEDLGSALRREADCLYPERLIVVASPESLAAAEGACAQLESVPNRQILRLASAHDLDEAFRKVNSAVESLLAEGIGPDQIAINYTSGTKMMGLGAALSAVFHRCTELRYLTGLAPASGRETCLVTTQPAAVFAFQDLLRAASLCMELRFASALRALRRVNDALLEPEERRLHADLVLVAEGYDLWDRFHPARFLEVYRTIGFDAPRMAPFRLGDRQLAAVEELAAEMRSGAPGGRLAIDLYNNGVRRFFAGAVDDATIRLYRALEFLAQWALRRDHGIDTNNVDTRLVPPRDRVRFEALRSMDSGLVKVGMRKSYELLRILESPLGAKYAQAAAVREFLGRRDESILAHGFAPITEVDARGLFDAARELFKAQIPDFEESCRLLQFPWIGIGKMGEESRA